MAQATHQNQIDRLATVIMDSNDAITLLDFDWQILAWNRGAERLYGYSEAEALSMNYLNIVSEDVRDEMRMLPHHLKFGRALDSCMSRRLRKDGQVLDVWLTMTLVRNEQGVADAIATTERDVTQLYRATSASSRLACLTVSDVMTHNAVPVRAEQTLGEAAQMMMAAGNGGAPIVDVGGRCIGMIRAVDYLARAACQFAESESGSNDVGFVMDKASPQVNAHDSLIDAARVMCDAHVDHVPVVNQHELMVGILSSFDLMSALHKVFEE